MATLHVRSSRHVVKSIVRSVRLSFLVRDRRTLALLLGGCLVAGGAMGAVIAFVSPLVALIGLAGVLGLVLMLQSPQWGLYAVVGVAILLPFGALPVNVGFKPSFLDGALGITFFVWFMRLAAGRVRQIRLSPLAPFVLTFMGVAVVAFVAGLEHAPLDKNTLRRFVEVMLGVSLFLVVVDHVRHRRQLEGLAVVIIVCGFLSALIGVVLYVLPQEVSIRLLSALRVFDYPAGPGVLRFIEDNPELPQRAISTSVDPNVFGGLLILVTAFTAPQIAAPRPLFPRWLTAIFLVTMGLAMVLTFSRGAMLGLLVGLAPLMVLRYRRLIPYAALGGVLLLFLPQSQVYLQRFVEGFRGQDLATQMRFGEYKDAWRLIRRYPWFGVGFSGTPDIDLYIGVSSVYLLMAEFMGLLGLGTFLTTMTAFFALTWRAIRSLQGDERVEPLLLGAVSAILGAMVGGIFDHYFFNITFPHSVALFWLFVGLAVAAAHIGREEQQAGPQETDVNPLVLVWKGAEA